MILRSESVENGDFCARRANSKIDFQGLNRIETPSLSENRFLNRKGAVIGARSSWLHAICRLDPPPGCTALWRGWQRLASMTELYESIDTPKMPLLKLKLLGLNSY
jgi:hypothetical protein